MKKILGLVVVLAALVLGSYFGMGLITERTINKNIDVINQSSGITAKVIEYKRGWYKSKALLNWSLHIPERLSKDDNGQVVTIAAEDYEFKTPVVIYHGPIMYTDTGVKFGLGYAITDVEMPAAYNEKFTNLFTDESVKPNVKLSLFVNYINKSTLHFIVPKFNLITKQGGDRFDWDGLDSYIEISSNMTDVDGGMAIDGAKLTKSKMKAILGKVTNKFDLHLTDMGLYLGDANLVVPSLIVTDDDKKIFDLEQLDLTSNSNINDGLLDSFFKASLSKYTVKDKTYGPAVLEVAIKNIDAKVLAELNADANKIQQGTTDADRQKTLLAMLPELPRLFSKGAKFEITKLNVVVPEGVIDGNLYISLPKGDLGNLFQLVQKINGQGMIKLPSSIIKSLMFESAKQKLLSGPAMQDVLVKQMMSSNNEEVTKEGLPTTEVSDVKTKEAKPLETAQTKLETTDASQNDQKQSIKAQEAKPFTATDIEEQAHAKVDENLAAMVKSGLLILNGTEYVVEVKFAEGQLTVNGKPFTSAMIQF